MLKTPTAAFVLVVARLSVAQTPAARPEFEVASVKLNVSSDARMFIGRTSPSPGRFAAANAPLKFLIQEAYAVKSSQVLGVPGWIESDRYDIDAKGAFDTVRRGSEALLMLQVLLEDRFKLRLHRETRELPVLMLTVVGGGPKMEQAKCGNPPGPGPSACLGQRLGSHGLNWTLDGTGATMNGLVNFLANNTGRDVIDKTGLAGQYDFQLEWAPDVPTGAPLGGADDRPAPVSDVTGPTIFSALHDQLGLKLESGKGPIEVLVIDHVEKPSAN
jgi:uncharacterized protein (TIGR03435 family)